MGTSTGSCCSTSAPPAVSIALVASSADMVLRRQRTIFRPPMFRNIRESKCIHTEDRNSNRRRAVSQFAETSSPDRAAARACHDNFEFKPISSIRKSTTWKRRASASFCIAVIALFSQPSACSLPSAFARAFHRRYSRLPKATPCPAPRATSVTRFRPTRYPTAAARATAANARCRAAPQPCRAANATLTCAVDAAAPQAVRAVSRRPLLRAAQCSATRGTRSRSVR
jgi:hypothetical protein